MTSKISQLSAGPEIPTIEQQRRFWDDWNDRNRRPGAMHPFMERQLGVALRVARRNGLNGGKILDIGCGTGWLGDALRGFGTVTGIDLSESAISQGRASYPELRLICGDFLAQSDLGDSYDLALSADSLAHVADHAAFVARVASLLRPGGTFLLMTQNPRVWNRISHALAPQGGLVVDRVPASVIRQMLAPHFDVVEFTTIVPGGNRGILFWVRYVRGLARVLGAGRLIDTTLERFGLGREYVFVAAKR